MMRLLRIAIRSFFLGLLGSIAAQAVAQVVR